MCTIISLPEFRWFGYFQKKVKRSARKKLEIFIRTVFRKMNMSFTEAAVQSSSTKQSILKKIIGFERVTCVCALFQLYVLFFSIVSAWRLKTFVIKILSLKSPIVWLANYFLMTASDFVKLLSPSVLAY